MTILLLRDLLHYLLFFTFYILHFTLLLTTQARNITLSRRKDVYVDFSCIFFVFFRL